MADDIEIHFDPSRGGLSLACGDEAFARVRDAVIAAARVGELAIEGVPAGVRAIEVIVVPSTKRSGRLRDRLELLGCGVVAFGAVFLLVVGAATIAGWMR